MNDRDHVEIRRAIDALALADGILDDIPEPEGDVLSPCAAAHVWIFRAMSLLIDSLDGVEEVTFSDEERVPIPVTDQPYTYLSGRHQGLSEKYQKLARDHEG